MHAEAQGSWNHQLLFHLIHRGRLFQSSPELADIVNLNSQLVLGFPSLSLVGAVISDNQSHPSVTYMTFWDLNSSFCIYLATALSIETFLHPWKRNFTIFILSSRSMFNFGGRLSEFHFCLEIHQCIKAISYWAWSCVSTVDM